MRAIDERDTGALAASGHDDGTSAPNSLVGALKTMGFEALDPDDIAIEFHDPLVRLVPAWSAAISESTLSTRRSDFRRFSRWCVARSEVPFLSDKTLAGLMERHLADAGQSFAPGTVKRIGSNLGALARGVGSDPAADAAQDFREQATRAAQKLERIRGFQHEKPHLTVSQMQSMRQAIVAEAHSLLVMRDLAIFDTACDLLASRSDITKLRLRDLSLSGATVRFSGTRFDQIDRGTVFTISRRAVASISAWLNASGHSDFDVNDAGALPLFAGVMNDGKIRLGPYGTPEAMAGRTVARALQRYAGRLGISGVTGHSLRRSMARALYEAGVPEEEIVRNGRWSSLDQMREYVGLTAPIQGAADLVFVRRS